MPSHDEVTLVHPERRQLLAFGQGKLTEQVAAEIEQHIAGCSACCELLKEVKDDTLIELARAAGNTPGPINGPTPGHTDAWGKATQPAKVQLQLGEIPTELRSHSRYRIVERLGEGGMGVVYKAEHRMMERFVALKVISLEFTAHPTAVERFRQEVRAAAKLSHANIVTAHDAEQAGDLHFLVMEYVDGVSLAKLVEKKGALPPAQAALFVRQVAQGLHHAHTHGMIHRDIKPHNLMVTRKGLVKILDFGLARFANRAGSNLTKAEMVVGTPDYMAPEQARDSRNVDTRADLYSLGCTMYFLLTGRPPFTAESAIALMFKHCEEEPTPVEKLRPEISPELAAVLRKLMAKNPADRYQTPAEAAAALMPFLRPLSQSLDLPQRSPTDTQDEDVPVAELLDGTDTTAVNVAPKTVPTGKRGSKRRPRGKSSRKQSSLIRLGVLSLLLGVLAALLVWKYWPDALSGGTNSADSQALAPRPPSRPGTGRGPTDDSARRAAPEQREDGPSVTVPGDGNRQATPPPLNQTGAQRVLFVLPRDLWYADYGPVRHVLEQEGFKVVTTSFAAECNASDQPGEVVRPDLPLNHVRGTEYAAVIFVGKDSGPYANATQSTGEFARLLLAEMKQADKHIAAICTGQYALLQHGYLDGKRVAYNVQMGERLQSKKDEPRAQAYLDHAERSRVVVDGKLITGSGPEAAVEFGQRLAAELKTARR